VQVPSSSIIPLIPLPRIDKVHIPYLTQQYVCTQKDIKPIPQHPEPEPPTTIPLPTNQHPPSSLSPFPNQPPLNQTKCPAAPAARPSTPPRWRCTKRWKSACWRRKRKRNKPNGSEESARAYPPRKVSHKNILFLLLRACADHDAPKKPWMSAQQSYTDAFFWGWPRVEKPNIMKRLFGRRGKSSVAPVS
jgi:hypothetical protein